MANTIAWQNSEDGIICEVEVREGWVYFRTLRSAPKNYMRDKHFRIEGVAPLMGERFGVDLRLSDIKAAIRDYERNYERDYSNEGKARIRGYRGGSGEPVFNPKLTDVPRIGRRKEITPKFPKLK